jgi:glycosyltransferase involved in cell wall biosynthesis
MGFEGPSLYQVSPICFIATADHYLGFSLWDGHDGLNPSLAAASRRGAVTLRKERPVRILYLIARLNIGGPAVHTILLSRIFSKGDYRSCLVSGNVSSHEGDMSYLASSQGVRPLYLSSLGRKISVLGDFRSFITLRSIIRRFKPHIIHTHTAKAGTLGRLGAISFNLTRDSGRKIRLVHTFHGHVFYSYFSPFKTRLFIEVEKFLARFTDRVVVISPSQKDDICCTYRIARPEKVSVVPLGFDLSPYVTSRAFQGKVQDPGLPSGLPGLVQVGIIGRLTGVKNHRLFLEAVKILKDQGKDQEFKFLVIGDGELKEELSRYASDLGVDSSVTFTGWQRDMPPLYQALDVVVVTSLNEGTPLTLIEAMAAGKAVISTDVGGVKDLFGVIDTKTNEGYNLAQHGILIPSGESNALARALLFVKENRTLTDQMAGRARAFVLREYTLERMVRNLDALYQEVLKDLEGRQKHHPR